MIKTSIKKAVKAKCLQCSYDEYGEGYRAVTDCLDRKCPLWAYRPVAREITPDSNWQYESYSKSENINVAMSEGEWLESSLTKEEKFNLEKRRKTALAMRAGIKIKV